VGYGNLVVVASEAYKFYYAHLSGFAVDGETCHPGKGNTCEQGSLIGSVGSTGNSTGPHLHFEVRLNNVAVDPYLFFGGSQTGSIERPTGGRLARLFEPTFTPPQGVAPVEFVVRMADGSPVGGGISVQILEEGSRRLIEYCPVRDGRCSTTLPAGVYPIIVEGTLPDGRPVGVGRGNIEAEANWEYLFGPLAFYHSHTASTVGVVLLSEPEENGLIGAYIDADPEAVLPIPVIPGSRSQTEAGAAAAIPNSVTALEPRATPTRPVHRVDPGPISPKDGLILTCLTVAGALILSLGLMLRRRIKSKNREAA
jgi:murein DD-endopeptidase MepM/ murein hydrolase activator NlpD